MEALLDESGGKGKDLMSHRDVSQDSILHMKCTILGSYIQYSAVAFFA